ncbi:MAG: family 10 glycosylhydrolase [Phormidesmis sp.]
MVFRADYKTWRKRWQRRLPITVLSGMMVLLAQGVTSLPAQAEVNRFCQLSQADVDRKESLRVAGLQGDTAAQQQYEALRQQQAAEVETCRRTTWPENQAIWLRLYPCDLQPGRLDALMDRITNLGYNQVYIEAFSNGQVLLPKNDNPTVWPSVVQSAEYADRDLLAEAIDKAHERDIEAFAWMFTMNFGYSYGQRSDRRQVLARNGQGKDTLDFADNGNSGTSEDAFIDPYNRTAQVDYAQMVRAVIDRQPDGALYDYVRYPRLLGGASVVSEVSNLWIYGPSASQALLQRAVNNKGRELISRYLQRGYITDGDVAQVDNLYPSEGEPLWQSRNPPSVDPKNLAPASARRPGLQVELWRLSVAHAIQGVVDFLQIAALPARQAGLPTGAVFFPNGNRAIGSGYDSRLQHWNRFPSWMDAHPMAYAICGNTGCIVDEVQRVLNVRPNAATVKPALAGTWGVSQANRPSLEAQMDALQRAAPRINTVSHWAFSWQDAEFDRGRKFCEATAQDVDFGRLRGTTSSSVLDQEESLGEQGLAEQGLAEPSSTEPNLIEPSLNDPS